MITWIMGVWGWLRANPVVSKILMWCAIGFALFVGAKTYKAKVESATRKKVEDERDVKRAREELALERSATKTIEDIKHEHEEKLVVAREAADRAGGYPTADSVPASVARDLFSD